jgi:hypothetical protein
MLNQARTEVEEISTDFSKMEKAQLLNYIEFMLKHLRYVDGFWYLFVEERFGSQVAAKLNEEVWATMGKIVARDIKEKFNIHEKGLEGFLEVQKYYYWAILTRYKIEKTDDALIITAPHCPPQEARLKKGRGEFNCKTMHRREFEAIAREIDDRIKIECVFAPPDPHPSEIFCKWRITCGE